MKRLLSKKKTLIKNASSPLSFQTTGGGAWEVWDRFLAVHGTNIYHIGNVCGTCAFFFCKLDTTEIPALLNDSIEKLNTGLDSIDGTTVKVLEKIIPDGKYEIALLSISPKLVLHGQSDDYFRKEQIELWDEGNNPPHSTQIDYYRGTDIPVNAETKLFEFFIPLTNTESLDPNRVNFYKKQISEGQKPTIVCLSIYDLKEPCIWEEDKNPEFISHGCLAHYIIDGHHKIQAVSELHSDITALCFLAVDKGIASQNDIKKMFSVL